jgi:hypothetical protein
LKAEENAEEHASDEILSAANNVLFLTAGLRNVEVLTLLDRHLPPKLNTVLSAAILEKEPPPILRLKSMTSPTLDHSIPQTAECFVRVPLRSATRNCLSELGEALCDSRSGSCPS